MMKLIGQNDILEDMKVLQKAFVQVVFEDRRDDVVLKECFDMILLRFYKL